MTTSYLGCTHNLLGSLCSTHRLQLQHTEAPASSIPLLLLLVVLLWYRNLQNAGSLLQLGCTFTNTLTRALFMDPGSASQYRASAVLHDPFKTKTSW